MNFIHLIISQKATQIVGGKAYETNYSNLL